MYTGCPGKIELRMEPNGNVVAGAVTPCDGSHTTESVMSLCANGADIYSEAQVQSWAQERLEGTLVSTTVRRITREVGEQPGYRRLLAMMCKVGALGTESVDDNTAMVQAMVGRNCAVLTWWSIKLDTGSRRSKRRNTGDTSTGRARMRDRDHLYVLTLPNHPDPLEVPRDYVEKTWAIQRTNPVPQASPQLLLLLLEELAAPVDLHWPVPKCGLKPRMLSDGCLPNIILAQRCLLDCILTDC